MNTKHGSMTRSLRTAFQSIAIDFLKCASEDRHEVSTWRHHGIGVLQRYINETLRLHVWYPPELELPGMRESGCGCERLTTPHTHLRHPPRPQPHHLLDVTTATL